MADIYDQHKAAFARCSAWVLLDAQGAFVGTVALKYPADGAGRLYAYCHVIGTEMQRAFAGGYGYDKATPAVSTAFAKARAKADSWREEANDRLATVQKALEHDSGHYWWQLLEKAGFRIIQAV